MSEQLRGSVEHGAESIDTSVESQKHLEKLREQAEQAERDPLQKHVESLAKSAEAQAVSGKEFNVGDKQGEDTAQTFGVQKELKIDSYKRTLRKIRSALPLHERAMSRVVHQPVVETVSNAASKTIARPSGFLGGAVIAFLGTSLFLYMAKHYGYSYNYAVLFMLFVGGFATGLLIELLVKLTFKRSSR